MSEVLSHTQAVALVERIIAADYVDDEELRAWMSALERSLSCPQGHISDWIHWPKGPELTAEQVVAKAVAYEPIAL